MTFLDTPELRIIHAKKPLIYRIADSDYGHTALAHGKAPYSLLDSWDTNLTLGRQIFTSSTRKTTHLESTDAATIAPGDFALMITEERVCLPADIMAFINVRTDWKLKGLVNISGFHVDPCYEGHLVFSVLNAGPEPIRIGRGDDTFKILFSRVGVPESPGERTTPKPILRLPDHLTGPLSGPGPNLYALHDKVQTLDRRIKVIWSVGAAIASVLITLGVQWLASKMS